jgi:type II secretory pathway component PulF
MVPFAVGGTIAWAVAGLILLPWRHSHPSWLWICVAGVVMGFVGIAIMVRHDANRRRRR